MNHNGKDIISDKMIQDSRYHGIYTTRLVPSFAFTPTFMESGKTVWMSPYFLCIETMEYDYKLLTRGKACTLQEAEQIKDEFNMEKSILVDRKIIKKFAWYPTKSSSNERIFLTSYYLEQISAQDCGHVIEMTNTYTSEEMMFKKLSGDVT